MILAQQASLTFTQHKVAQLEPYVRNNETGTVN